MSGVPSARGDMVPSVGSLVSTGSLRPISRESSLRKGVPFGGKSYLGGAVDFFLGPSLREGEAQPIPG